MTGVCGAGLGIDWAPDLHLYPHQAERKGKGLGFRRAPRNRMPNDARRRAIAETSAFLTWALNAQEDLPRIPRRRADQGGFSGMIRRPLAATLVAYWWAQALERIR